MIVLKSDTIQRPLCVEQGDFKGRPIRRYDDGSFKAATSDGWLKFPSLEALSEYHAYREFMRLKQALWFEDSRHKT